MYIHVKEKDMTPKNTNYPFGSSFEEDKDGAVKLTITGVWYALKLHRIDENDAAETFLRDRYNRENGTHYTEGYIYGRGSWAEFMPLERVIELTHSFYFDEDGYCYNDEAFENNKLENNSSKLKAIVKFVNRFYDNVEPVRA